MTGGSSLPSWRLLSALRLLSGWGVRSDVEGNHSKGGVQMRWVMVLAMVLAFGCGEEPSEEVNEESNEETSEAPTR